jgi:hypothetical protein
MALVVKSSLDSEGAEGAAGVEGFGVAGGAEGFTLGAGFGALDPFAATAGEDGGLGFGSFVSDTPRDLRGGPEFREG